MILLGMPEPTGAPVSTSWGGAPLWACSAEGMSKSSGNATPAGLLNTPKAAGLLSAGPAAAAAAAGLFLSPVTVTGAGVLTEKARRSHKGC